MGTLHLQYAPQWSGGRIGSGVSVFNLNNAVDGVYNQDAVATAIRAWFENRKIALPNDVTIRYPTEMKVIATATGELVDILPVAGLPSTVGTSTGVWANGMGRVVRWTTGEVVNGHRVKGHTYLVPSADVYENNGDIYAATIAADNVAHGNLLTALSEAAAPLGVWTRPVSGGGGAMSTVITGATLGRPSGLRTRND